MRLLLDTHAVLWFWWNDGRLSPAALAAIREPSNQKLVSWTTAWETAIKVSLGKLIIGGPFRGFFRQHMAANNFSWHSIAEEHLELVAEMPLHHRDPFDRILVAQSLTDNLTLVSADGAFDAYGVRRLW